MKSYSRSYFDKWYRDPRHSVISPGAMARRAAWIVGTAEYVIGRQIRSVLDVACGEGHWESVLRRLRPGVRYTGVDPSPYVLRRFGRRRNIIAGHVEALDVLDLAPRYDIVICCAALNYLPRQAVARGLEQMAARTGGIAHIELFARADPVEGDFRGWRWYSRDWVRRTARRAGFVPIGLHCYAPRGRRDELAALEVFDG
jgi:SAM-dependent methyltransferase